MRETARFQRPEAWVARKFLYVIAALIVLVLLGAVALRLWGTELSRVAFVPNEQFEEQPALLPSIYDRADMWIAHPALNNNPARWQPAMEGTEQPINAVVFFIHPTSYLTRSRWNAPLDDPDGNWRAALFVRGMASVFNQAPEIWAPRYRQATFGAFLTDSGEAKLAIDLAYRDILQAFDAFVARQPNGQPIILAGHSQGSLHLTRLMKERIAGKPIAKQIIAAYAIGWPISVEADLPAMGLPQCTRPDETRCLLSWESFAEPADYDDIITTFEKAPSLTGKPRKDTKLVCTNPLTGMAGGSAPATANRGTLKNDEAFTSAELVAGAVPARCDAKGFLLIGEGPDLGPYVLPGNNYHVYDYSLFWRNIRFDVERRARAFR
jgi:hypothetical protein